MKETSTFDQAVKDLFQRDRPTVLLDLLTDGIPVRQILNVELAQIIERRADTV
jgi:hypothetical protein